MPVPPLPETPESSRQRTLRLEVLERVQNLATASLGLVAALAWNDAIQGFFVSVFGTQSNLTAKFLYAILVTTIVVTLTLRLSRLINRVKRHHDANPV